MGLHLSMVHIYYFLINLPCNSKPEMPAYFAGVYFLQAAVSVFLSIIPLLFAALFSWLSVISIALQLTLLSASEVTGMC